MQPLLQNGSKETIKVSVLHLRQLGHFIINLYIFIIYLAKAIDTEGRGGAEWGRQRRKNLSTLPEITVETRRIWWSSNDAFPRLLTAKDSS